MWTLRKLMFRGDPINLQIFWGILIFFSFSFSQEPAIPENSAEETLPLVKFEEANLVSALSVISSSAGQQIILDSTVQGKISVTLLDKTFKQAVDTICQLGQLKVLNQNGVWFFSKISEKSSMPVLTPKTEESRELTGIKSEETKQSPAEIIVEAVAIRVNKELLEDKGLKPWISCIDSTLLAQDRGENHSAPEFFYAKFTDSSKTARLFWDEWMKEGKSSLVTKSKVFLKRDRETQILLSEQIPIHTINSQGKHKIQMLDIGTRIWMTALSFIKNRLEVSLKLEKQYYLIDPGIGMLEKSQKGKTQISLADSQSVIFRDGSKQEKGTEDVNLKIEKSSIQLSSKQLQKENEEVLVILRPLFIYPKESMVVPQKKRELASSIAASDPALP